MLWGMRVGPVVRGMLTYVPGSGLREDEHTGGHHADAEYFYEIWIKHLTIAVASGMPGVPRVVAELGPGDAIGCGLAALLSGAQTYYALDATPFTRVEDNLPLFDALVELFRRRAPRHSRGWPDYDAQLDAGLFPSSILTRERMDWCLHPERIAQIRGAIASGGEGWRRHLDPLRRAVGRRVARHAGHRGLPVLAHRVAARRGSRPHAGLHRPVAEARRLVQPSDGPRLHGPEQALERAPRVSGGPVAGGRWVGGRGSSTGCPCRPTSASSADTG